MFFLRLLANLIDIAVGIMALIGTMVYVFPMVNMAVGYDMAAAAISIVLYVVGLYLIHYPFMIVGQTIGKAFFRLRIVTTNHERPLTPAIIASREVFGKLMPFYTLCLPVIFGKEGKHDEVSQTKVIMSASKDGSV